MTDTSHKPLIAAIIPAYNEEHSIGYVVMNLLEVAKTHQFNLDVIVVNDSSTDNTSQIAAKLDCILINLPSNLGIGGAVQTGFKYAFLKGYDFAMQVDGDGQHPPKEISKIILPALANEADVMIGSRFLEKSGFQSTFLRRLGINYFKHIIKVFCGIRVSDCTSGFRIINSKALEIVKSYYPDEYPEPESVIQFHQNNLTIKEVQVEMNEREGGKSSIRAFNTLYYMIKVTIAILFTYIRLKKHKIK